MEVSTLTTALAERLSNHDILRLAEQDIPSYWPSDPATLASTANIGSVTFGTGHSVYRSAILPAIEEAQCEVILVTCFWARSDTSDDLADTLHKLAVKASKARTTIRVRIYFSSSSLLQKLLHTPSVDGKTYPPDTWQSTFGLPSPEELQGLDLEIKSVFVLPFSVMHPKFIIIDRHKVFLPSCNVSWEEWFEGCLELNGPVVEQFVRFWRSFWAAFRDFAFPGTATTTSQKNIDTRRQPSNASLLATRKVSLADIPSIFLPSPHHQNPHLRLPWQPPAQPPPTPLNLTLLTLFARATKTIFIQTPNLTAQPVLAALLGALKRGVNLHVMTSEKLMVLEQLVTAGTTNARCMHWLRNQHQQLLQQQRHPHTATLLENDLESGLLGQASKPGRLTIEYHRSRTAGDRAHAEPTQSHLKLTIIDDRVVVHGSGNMDRASWFTSQELGVAFVSEEFVHSIRSGLEEAMKGRSEVVYDSR
ncbi:hypothetical protein B0A50_08217 [Salinomyces thailandicus]|uniref:PLD phosphodiesterase domain-containing protein n=1 Tax=Salinomyces thailandicus TaxID=706561 RepID=A0A4U0TJY7_9PEZI|nr:hypothetical protein B0A50_08217 [Salinomyces thailandica]